MAPKANCITADVAFDSAEDLQWAIETHNGVTKIRGRTLTLKPSAKDPCSAVVGNLPADIDGDELSVLFAEGAGDGVEGDEEVEVEVGGEEEEEVEIEGEEVKEPPKKKAKGGKAFGKKTSAAAADSSDDDGDNGPSGAVDKTFEVRYADPSHAQKAAKTLNGAWWDDKTQARVKLDDSGAKIFLRVAAAGVSWQDVKTFCASAGTVIFTGEKGSGKDKGKGKGMGKEKGKSKTKKGGKPLPADSDSSSDEGGKGKSKGKTRSGCFRVKFHDAKHARKAVKKLNGAWWDDSTQAKVTEDSQCWDGTTVNVEILATVGVKHFDLKAWCEQIGPVVLAMERKGKSKGKGLKDGSGKSWSKPSAGEFEVRYESAKHAARCAKKLNGAWWDDNTQATVQIISDDKCIVRLDDPSIKWQDVKDWASTIGTVVFCGPKGKGKGKSSDEW